MLTFPAKGFFIEWVWILLVLVILVGLIVSEYMDHDCINDKLCWSRVNSITATASQQELLYNLHEILRSDLDHAIWRQGLIAAIGSSILIVIFLYGRFPAPFELFFIGLLIFLGVYFSASWMRAHFHAPNTRQIEKGLSILEEKISSNRNHNIC